VTKAVSVFVVWFWFWQY